MQNSMNCRSNIAFSNFVHAFLMNLNLLKFCLKILCLKHKPDQQYPIVKHQACIHTAGRTVSHNAFHSCRVLLSKPTTHMAHDRKSCIGSRLLAFCNMLAQGDQNIMWSLYKCTFRHTVQAEIYRRFVCLPKGVSGDT